MVFHTLCRTVRQIGLVYDKQHQQQNPMKEYRNIGEVNT